MATPLTRQDILAITDGAKNKILNQMLNRRDVQLAADNARDRILNTVNAFHVETQTLLRQTNNQNDQMWRRVATLESQIMAARQDIRMLTQAVNRLYDMQAIQQAAMAKGDERNAAQYGQQQPGY
jgi:hypothetical protein